MRGKTGVKKVICYLATSAGDWGGASRYLFVTLKKLDREKYQPFVLFPSPGPIFEQLDRLGISYAVRPEHEPTGLPAYLRDIFTAMRLFRIIKADVLHVNHVGYWRPAEILAAWLLRIPVITHLHRVVREPPPYLRLSAAVVANSRFTAEESQSSGVPKRVVLNSVDTERYDRARDIRPELGLGPGEVVIAFIGQVRQIKGVDAFLRLAAHGVRPNVRFLVAGACRDRDKFPGSYTEQDLLEEQRKNPRLKYLGYRADVENIYRASDIIIMPSQWDEPFGLINIEAGASRRPIISTRVGGIPEVVRHGINGFLVERDDAAALVAHATRLVNDPQLRKRMGEQGREIVEREFTDRPVRVLEAIYDELA